MTASKHRSAAAIGRRFLCDERGATAIEYGLIVSLIFLAITAAVRGFATESNNMYSEIQSALVN